MKKLDFVHIKQGSASTRRFSQGNTLPLTQLPFGMIAFAPQTASDRGNWFYHPADRCLEGIRLTHQPSPWIGDYGAILLLPQSGVPQTEAERRWSGCRTEDQCLRPDLLKVTFLRSGAVFELTPTQRGAAFRLRFPDDGQRHSLSILPVGGDFSAALDEESGLVFGSTDYHCSGQAENFRMHFVVQLTSGSWQRGEATEDAHSALHLSLRDNEVEGQLAISYIHPQQALCSLRRELSGRTFETVRQEAAALWEEHLSRIEVETETEEQLRTFYSCLYRLFLYPHRCYEINPQGEAVHYCPRDGAVRKGVRYTDNGFWDTFRTVYPLLSIIAPAEYAEILEGFIQDYRDGGVLPRWPSIGEVGCMPSTLIDAVIADAAVKGILPRDSLQTALDGMLRHASTAFSDRRFGRNGIDAYLKYGYVPWEEESQSVNLTLDFAYGDFCIAQVAQILGKPEIEAAFRERALNYRHLFDPESGFMRPKGRDGAFKPGFCPIEWGGGYTEGSAWQNSFFVPHDLEGLCALYGGKEGLLNKLRTLFATPPDYRVGGYPGEIHEMTEMAAVDFGQCAISNQPSFHLPFLFAALGSQEESDFWVEKICRALFSSSEAGFPGDEDNGSMSAWYLFCSLGLYPLCPGKPVYLRGKMLVKSAKINGSPWNSQAWPQWIPHEALPLRTGDSLGKKER